MKLVSVVGTRPQLIKAAALQPALRARHAEVFVDTGQHWDESMAGSFFAELGLAKPDHALGAGGGSHAQQTAAMLTRLEPILVAEAPEAVLVFGDTNSTLAGALAAAKLGIPVAHVEAGLRSFDRRMPEEMNRILTDQLSELLFATEESAVQNLLNEGIGKERIFWVGNVMIDALISHAQEAERSTILRQLNLAPQGYALLTLHRPSNVDTQEGMHRIFALLSEVEKRIRVVFPVHQIGRAHV